MNQIFDDIFENQSSIALLISPKSLRIVNANDSACKFYGYQRNELKNMQYSEISELPEKSIMARIKKVTARSGQHYHSTHKLAGGNIISVTENISVFLHQKEIEFLIIVVPNETGHDSEKKLKVSEDNFKAIFDNVDDAIFVKDKNLKILDVNKAAEKLFGYSRDELLSEPEMELGDHLKNDYSLVPEYIQGAMNGIPQLFEWWGLNKDRISFPEEIMINKTIYNGREVLLFMIRDISEIKKAEKAILESENKFRTIVKSTEEIFFMINTMGVITLSEGKGLKVLGLKPGQLVGQSVFELYKEFPDVIIGIKKALAGDRIYKKINLNGIYFNSLYTPFKDIDGNIEGIIGLSINITEKELARIEAVKMISQLNESQKVTRVGSYILDITGDNWSGSETLFEIFGMENTGQNNTQTWIDLLFEKDREEMVAYFQNLVITNAERFDKEYRIQRKSDGQIRWVHGLGRFNFDEINQTKIMYGTIQDITERKISEISLRESELKFRSVFENSEDAICLLLNAVHILVNPAYTTMFGYESDIHIFGNKFYDLFIPENKDDIYHYLKNPRKNNSLEVIGQRLDKVKFNVEMKISEYQFAGKKYSVIILRDITEKKKSEEKLLKSETLLRAMIETSKDWIWATNRQGIISFTSPVVETILGYRPEELLGKPGIQFVDDSDQEFAVKKRKLSIRKKEGWTNLRIRYKHKFGHYKVLESNSVPIIIDDEICGFRGVDRDITEQIKNENLIKKSLQEKETLLQEVHHRVKNNFQVISSLLHLQEKEINDPKIAMIFAESRNRIRSMSLVHESLYNSSEHSKILLEDYTNNLLKNIYGFYGKNEKIAIVVKMDTIFIDLVNAVPLGLVLNELVSNIFKYAFPDGRTGNIHIFAKKMKDQKLNLVIRDDGIGLPDDIDIRNTRSLGLKLVCLLAENQLSGRINLSRNQGTKFDIQFDKEFYSVS